jgi:thiamine biosynthesis protein ThiS
MTITVNGNMKEFAFTATIQQLLEALGLDAARVAVERNRDIVPRDRFAETVMTEGDILEIVQFVGGG